MMNGDAADRRGPRHAGDHWRDTAGLSQEGGDRPALPHRQPVEFMK